MFFFTRESGVTSSTQTRIVSLCCYSMMGSIKTEVMVCRHCSKGFVCQQWFRSHEEGVLRPVEDLVQDQVHSDASLRIGQGNLFRGQENKEMFFPTTITFFPTPRDVSVVKEG